MQNGQRNKSMKMTKTLATLKRIAEKTNISQALLAKRMRVTEATISRWFSGDRSPSIQNIEKMAEALDCRVIITLK